MPPTGEIEIVDGHLVRLDPASREAITTHEPLATQVVQYVPMADRVIVREAYYRFPRGESNVYCLDSDLRLLWKAELPRTSDVYSGPIILTRGVLACSSWEGYTCILDPATGRIRSRSLTR